MLRPVVASSLILFAVLLAFVPPAVAVPSSAPPATPPAPAQPGDVVIAEIANSGPEGPSQSFFELRNDSGWSVDLSGWTVFRCDEEGLRAKPSAPEVALDGVVLRPGEHFLAGHMSGRLPVAPDAVFPQALPALGFGLVLVAPDGAVGDDVAVYPSEPAPTLSECGSDNLSVALAAALGESWQRTPDGEWVRGRRTPGNANIASGDPVVASTVRIEEVAPAGPAGHSDDFVELRNAGRTAVDIGGWRLYRCTAQGEASVDTLQHTFPRERELSAGERIVIGGPEYTGDVEARAGTSLADLVSGVLLVTDDGRRVDGLTISSQFDTACQTGDDKLASILDYRTGESWQRDRSGEWLVAPRTPGGRNASIDQRLDAGAFAYPGARGVAISELATDPALDREGYTRHAYLELANYGSSPADLSGWRVVACTADGFRSSETLAQIGAGTGLAPGDTWLAALEGTGEAENADAVFTTPFELAGAGVWIEDADGRRIDSIGVYHRNEMDESVERHSPCTKGLGLATFSVDRLRRETYQRAGFSGDDASDFTTGVATPGVLDLHNPADPAQLLDQAGTAAAASAATALEPRTARGVSWHPAASLGRAQVRAVFAGSSPTPLETRTGDNERTVDPSAAVARDDAYGLPYIRLVVDVPGEGGTVAWSGRTVGRSALGLSVWDPDASTWRSLAIGAGSRTAESGEAEASVTLSGEVRANEIAGGMAELLVQVVPRDAAAVAAAAGIASPHAYDLAVAHITDTQYYSESYPEIYAAEIAWILRNATARKIDFAIHTGDLIQNWVDPDQREDRARHEFEVASQFQATLDEGVANSVLPGNHDNKRGLTNDLFNEYFGPDRYAGASWYGGSIGPDDNSANWSWFEAGGARFVVLSLPYAYGDAEIAWAQTVVAAHPDANIIVATHEHITPKLADTAAARSNSSRWVSHADLLWNRVVAPNRNVVLVLSGHFHGIGAIVTEDAGGIEGHTVVEALADYQEFRTHTGERATGFQRLLQFDLASGTLAVDTFSVPLEASASYPYDYTQFVPDNGSEDIHSNERPWNVVDRGLQRRYTEEDDAFAVRLNLQHAKALETDAVLVGP